ncbi:MAG: peptidase S9 [Actinomycetaceae bacterium]|nr:peptidase S9 [Actinomycetaceae bacterium]
MTDVNPAPIPAAGPAWSPTVPEIVSSAIITGVGTIAWYAMPDVIHSRPARTVLKVGLLGAMSAQILAPLASESSAADLWQPGIYEQEEDTEEIEAPEGPRAADLVGEVLRNPARHLPILASTAGALALGAVGAVAGERWIFNRGERRRRAGVRGAHLRQAIPLAALAVAVDVLTSVPFYDSQD